MHQLAKSLLARHLNAARGIRFRFQCPRCARHAHYSLRLPMLSEAVAREEHTLPSGARVDVCVTTSSGDPVVAIEVLHTHRSSCFSRMDVPWFEVRAQEIVSAFETGLAIDLIELDCRRQDRGTCAHAMCVTTKDIAQSLGYFCLNDMYDSDNHREKDAAVRGKYRLPLDEWYTNPDFSDIDVETTGTMWREFLRRRQCMRCLATYDSQRGRPFCRRCYSQTKGEEEVDKSWAWQQISDDDKKRLREKFGWLRHFASSDPGDACQVCESNCQGYTFWFGLGGNRRLCDECLAAWRPSLTHEYVAKATGRPPSSKRTRVEGIARGL